MQGHSLYTTLSVCKPSTCFGYCRHHQAEYVADVHTDKGVFRL